MYMEHSYFKIYLLDIGLIAIMSELNPFVLIHEAEIVTHFEEALIPILLIPFPTS